MKYSFFQGFQVLPAIIVKIGGIWLEKDTVDLTLICLFPGSQVLLAVLQKIVGFW